MHHKLLILDRIFELLISCNICPIFRNASQFDAMMTIFI